LRYYCCHEAGHAVVADCLGYQIRRIRVTPGSRDESFVEYEPDSWECQECHAHIKSRHEPKLLAALDDNCASCKEEKFRFIVRCLAGEAATSILQEPEHDSRESGFDKEQVSSVYPPEVFPSSPANPSPERCEAFRIGEQKAREMVEKNKPEIEALRDALIAAGGSLTGCDARRIIRGKIKMTLRTREHLNFETRDLNRSR
jgi:hypothetical protein